MCYTELIIPMTGCETLYSTGVNPQKKLFSNFRYCTDKILVRNSQYVIAECRYYILSSYFLKWNCWGIRIDKVGMIFFCPRIIIFNNFSICNIFITYDAKFFSWCNFLKSIAFDVFSFILYIIIVSHLENFIYLLINKVFKVY